MKHILSSLTFYFCQEVLRMVLQYREALLKNKFEAHNSDENLTWKTSN